MPQNIKFYSLMGQILTHQLAQIFGSPFQQVLILGNDAHVAQHLSNERNMNVKIEQGY